jgi:hypothetical protein
MNRQRTKARLLAALIATGIMVFPAISHAYSGILLSTDSGILGTGAWITPGPAWLEWSVTQNTDDSWHYSYLFGHPDGETSHLILEVSPTFTANDIFGEVGDFGSIEIGTFEGGPGNPEMPGTVYGIKFDDAWGTTSSFAFDSWREPMWGDFYSKDGKTPGTDIFNTAWNAGFLDADPTAPVQDGAYMGHLLVPDTDGPPPPVPEPSTMLLLGSGLLGSIVALRKRGR